MNPSDQPVRILRSGGPDAASVDALYFFDPADMGKPQPAPLTSLAAIGKVIHRQSRPTHLASIAWSAEGYSPNWVVLLRADDTAEIIDLDATKFQEDSTRTAKNLLKALHVPVLSGGIDLGNPPPSMPFSFAGVFPSDKEFAKIIGNPEFVRWLRGLIDVVQ